MNLLINCWMHVVAVIWNIFQISCNIDKQLDRHIGYWWSSEERILFLDTLKFILLCNESLTFLLQNYGYSVNQLFDLLHEIRDHYNEVLMQRWVQVFREILDEESFLPIQVSYLRRNFLIIWIYHHHTSLQI